MPRIVENLEKYNALFLIAPAGWGKTSLIFKLFERNNTNIIFVSPLKALEKEVERKALNYQKKNFFFKSLTAERVGRFLDGLTIQEKENLLIIIDEIHLWNFWGSKFRERLWECFYQIANEGLPLLALSATLREEFEKEWLELLEHGGYRFKKLDYGNGRIQHLPDREFSFYRLAKSQFLRRMIYELEKGGSSIIFCRYREEVARLSKKIKGLGIDVKSCVGGESLKFVEECERYGLPKVIVCTSTLSHGVNLGNISKVFITYEVKDWDLHLQMIARGGRNGRGFEVYSYQRSGASLWNKFKILLFDRYLQLFYA